MRSKTGLLILVSILVCSIVLPTCVLADKPITTASAGGWIRSAGADWWPGTADAGEDLKATLGLQVKVAETVSGNFTFQDRGSGVNFHANVKTYSLEGNFIVCSGTYYPKDGGASGTVWLVLVDFDEPNKGYLEIGLSGGAYAGYNNWGSLQGGNMQVEYENDLG